MEIADARVATFHYTLTDDGGQVIDQSPESQPLPYMHGAGNIVPGLEKALAGKAPGDRFEVDVKPEEGYGLRNEGLVQVVPRSLFEGADRLEPGMQFRTQGSQNGRGPMVITVTKVGDEQVTIDGNHPLAGKTLHFVVEVADVREATEAEKEAGAAAA